MLKKIKMTKNYFKLKKYQFIIIVFKCPTVFSFSKLFQNILEIRKSHIKQIHNNEIFAKETN